MMTNPGNRIGPSGQAQKIVFVQRPQTPNAQAQQIISSQQMQSSTTQANTVVKFVSAGNAQHAQKSVNAAPKILVVSMPGATQTTHTPSQASQGGQPPISVVPKPIYAQQGMKSNEQIVPPPDIDDLSHLA